MMCHLEIPLSVLQTRMEFLAELLREPCPESDENLVKEYKKNELRMFESTIMEVERVLPSTNPVLEITNMEIRGVLICLAKFVITFLEKYREYVEEHCLTETWMLVRALKYMILLTKADDDSLLETCLDFWQGFLVTPGRTRRYTAAERPRRFTLPYYMNTHPLICDLFVRRMPNPEDIHITLDGNGQLVRHCMEETYSLHLYGRIKLLLFHLTLLDENTLQSTIQTLIIEVCDSNDHANLQLLRSLCWSIGTYMGGLNIIGKYNNTHLAGEIIQKLLTIAGSTNNNNVETIAWRNVFYILGACPSYFTFSEFTMRAVLNKLVDFLKSTDYEIRNLACDCFMKLAKQCPETFVAVPYDDPEPYIEVILLNLANFTSLFDAEQSLMFYKGVSYIIKVEKNLLKKERFLNQIFAVPKECWNLTMARCAESPKEYYETDTANMLTLILKTYVVFCDVLSLSFKTQLDQILEGLPGFCTAVSNYIHDFNSEDKKDKILHESMWLIREECVKLIRHIYMMSKQVDNELTYPNLLKEIVSIDAQLLCIDGNKGSPFFLCKTF